MPVGEKQTFRFGPFQLDTQCGQLRKDGVGLKLQGQPIQVLEILLEKPGQLVTREEIRQRLWTSDTFVDFDHSLNTAVKKLRQTLGDEADTPCYIETLPKRGYRFIGEIEQQELREEAPASLSAIIPVEPVANPSNERSGRLPWKWVLVICVFSLLAAIGVEAYRSFRSDPLPRVTGSHLLVNNVRPTTMVARPFTDGTSIYFQEERPAGLITLQVPVTGGEVSEIPAPHGLLSDISRDGSEMLFWVPRDPRWNEVDAWTQPLPAGPARLIVRDSAYPIWNADGRSIFFTRKGKAQFQTEIYRANADGTDVQWLASWPEINRLRLSPDGSHIRFVEETDNQIVDIGTDGSSPHVLPIAGHRPIIGGSFSPDGKFFFFSMWDGDRYSLWVVPEGRSRWKKSTLVPKQLTFGPLALGVPMISKDGRQIYVRGVEHRGELSVYDRDLGKFVPYLGGISVCYVDFSRDGQWMAYVTYPDGTLWRSRIDGSETRQLTSQSMAVMNPRWSPDGKLIAFVDLANGDRQHNSFWPPQRVYVVSAEGGSPMLMLGAQPGLGDPTWSPDGKSIAYSITPDGDGHGGEVRILDLQTQKSTKVLGSEGIWSPRWSPDGRYLVAVRGPFWAASRMMLFTFSTNTWQELASGVNLGWESWSRDSRFVYGHDGDSLLRVEVSNHKKEKIASLSGFRSTAYYLDVRSGDGWYGLDPNDRPITMRDTGIQGLYAFDLVYK